jgi:hypothetical protein
VTTDPTIADLFEAAGYGRPGNDIDEHVLWLLTERHLLNTEVRELRLLNYLDLTAGSLAKERRIGRLRGAAIRYRRAWYAGIRPYQIYGRWEDRMKDPSYRKALERARDDLSVQDAMCRRLERLRKAALRYRRENREYDKLTDKLLARNSEYLAERDGQKLLAQGALAALDQFKADLDGKEATIRSLLDQCRGLGEAKEAWIAGLKEDCKREVAGLKAELKEYEITRSKGKEWLAHIKVQDTKLQRQGDDLRRLQTQRDCAYNDILQLELKLIHARDGAQQACTELEKVEPGGLMSPGPLAAIRAAIKILSGDTKPQTPVGTSAVAERVCHCGETNCDADPPCKPPCLHRRLSMNKCADCGMEIFRLPKFPGET